MRISPVLLALIACEPLEPPVYETYDLDVADPSDSEPTDVLQTEQPDQGDGDDTDEPDWWDAQDVDGDGVLPEEGDCNDHDDTVVPGAPDDECDGIDNDCDGAVDEHALDDEPLHDLGDLTDTTETLVNSYLFPEGDADSVRFYVEDEFFGWFDIEAWAYQVPIGIDVTVSLYRIDGPQGGGRELIEQVDEGGPGDFELVNYPGRFGLDDSGWYEVVLATSQGSDCGSPVQLQINVGTL